MAMADPKDEEYPWPVEEIPDNDSVFLRVHKTWRKKSDGSIAPSAFKPHDGGMSTDWEKYSTAEETRQRGKPPVTNYAVVSLEVASVRKIDGLQVKHSPLIDNRSHSDVTGGDVDEARVLLRRIAKTEIPFGD